MAVCFFKPNDPIDFGSEKSINDVLCEELLLSIFQNFSLRDIFPLRRVCRLWTHLINENILWKRNEVFICQSSYGINKYFQKKNIIDSYLVKNQKQIEPLAIYHRNLKKLKIFNFLIDSWILNILSQMNQLESLSFIDCTFNYSGLLTSMFEIVENIACLELINTNINDEHVLEIARLKQLKSLNISNSKITFRNIGELSESLKILISRSCSALNPIALFDSLRTLSEKGAKLEVIDFRHSNYYYSRISINWPEIFDCNSYLQHLQKIKMTTGMIISRFFPSNQPDQNPEEFEELTNIQYVHFIDDDIALSTLNLQDVLRACINLKVLKLEEFRYFGDSEWMQVYKLKSLMYLKMKNIRVTNDNLMDAIKNCPNLRKISIDCPKMLNPRFLNSCREFFEQNPNRNMEISVSRSGLPSHKTLSYLPKNLKLTMTQQIILEETILKNE